MVLLFGISTPNALATGNWIISTDGGCKVYNREPQPNETITWSGKCVNGYAQGYGKVEWHVNSELHSTYIGDYHQGHMHGKGTITYVDGGEYTGDWKESKRHGSGAAKYADNTEYTGEWQDDARYGKGKQALANGDTYDGDYQNGKPHGKGLFITSFMIYDGEFDNGKYDGWGIFIDKNTRNIYEGQFKDDTMNGVGRYLFVNDADLHSDHKKYGYLQDNYMIRPAIFKDGYIDTNLTKEQHAKAVQKLGKKVQRPKDVLLPFRKYLKTPTISKAQ